MGTPDAFTLKKILFSQINNLPLNPNVMTEKEEEKTEELCYYRLNLMSLLKSSYPEYLDDEDFISSRAQEAARVFEDAVRNGSNYLDASAEANRTLYRGLGFSKFDMVFTVLTEEFAKELKEEEFRPFALKMMSVCEDVFARYELHEDFEDSPEYDVLYTEITGRIVTYIENNGIDL